MSKPNPGLALLVGFITLTPTNPALSGNFSIGPNGIASAGLTLPLPPNAPAGTTPTPLTGAGIGIAMVEPTRPGDPVADFSNDSFFNSTVDPERTVEITFSNPAAPSTSLMAFSPTVVTPTPSTPAADWQVTEHPTEVAGIMISTDTNNNAAGVAPGARLFAAGNNATSRVDVAYITSTQYIRQTAGIPIRAVNLSFAVSLMQGNTLDGNQLYTQYLDWSARQHDVLYLSAGNQLTPQGNPDGFAVPTDNYNGMTVAMSRINNGVCREVYDRNDFRQAVDAVGTRTSVDILAPGLGVMRPTIDTMPAPGQPANTMLTTNAGYGTSYATPHVIRIPI